MSGYDFLPDREIKLNTGPYYKKNKQIVSDVYQTVSKTIESFFDLAAGLLGKPYANYNDMGKPERDEVGFVNKVVKTPHSVLRLLDKKVSIANVEKDHQLHVRNNLNGKELILDPKSNLVTDYVPSNAYAKNVDPLELFFNSKNWHAQVNQRVFDITLNTNRHDDTRVRVTISYNPDTKKLIYQPKSVLGKKVNLNNQAYQTIKTWIGN